MNYFHESLSSGGWQRFSLVEQMANIGSEVYRALNSRQKGNSKDAELAFERALELFDLTLSDPKNKKRLKEAARTREEFADYFTGQNEYKTSAEALNSYFLAFGVASRQAK